MDDKTSEERVTIQLTVNKNCSTCKGSGWRTYKEFDPRSGPPICGPGSRNQYIKKSGFCYCVKPAAL